MNSKLMFLILGVSALSVSAFAGERVKIWPEGLMPNAQKHQIAAMTDEKVKGTEPYIEWFELDAAPDYENVVNSMEQRLVEKFKLV